MQTNYVRDNLGRVTQMSHSWNSIYLAAYTSTYDAAGRLTNSSRATYSNFGGVSGADTSTYTHDRIGQLTGVVRNPGSPASESYVYDPAGNRAVSGATTYTNVANNRIQSDGTYTYVYDEEGNITERKLTANPLQKTVFAYDHRNRLFALSEFNSAGTNVKNVVYAYDVFNRRVIKGIDPDGGAPQYTYDYTYFVYDTDDIVLALKAGGAHSNRYLHGPAVDEVLADENTQNVLWPLRDQFYNVRDLVNHGSSHYNHIDYDAFGKVTYESNPAPAYLAHAYGFQSRERDQESGLNYHRNRYYDAAIGRWMSEDPIGFAGGDYNLNRFVGNGPANWTDPNGLQRLAPLIAPSNGKSANDLIRSRTPSTEDPYRREKFGIGLEANVYADIPNAVANTGETAIELIRTIPGGNAGVELGKLLQGQGSIEEFTTALLLDLVYADDAQRVLQGAAGKPGLGFADDAVGHGAAGRTPRVGPRAPTIRNVHLAGKKHPVTGIPFDARGYP